MFRFTERGKPLVYSIISFPFSINSSSPFSSDGRSSGGNIYALTQYIGGYFNTTADITAMQFKFESGNIDSGTIKLYGIA